MTGVKSRMETQKNIIEPTNKSHRILFTVVTILLTAGVIGGSVWYVLNQELKKQNTKIEELQKNQTAKTKTKEVSKTEEKKTDLAANWLSYESKELGISFKYPKEWGTVKINKFSEGELINANTRSLLKGDTIDITFSGNSKVLIASRTPNFSYPAGIFVSALKEAENGVTTGLENTLKSTEVTKEDDVGPNVIIYDKFLSSTNSLSFIKGLYTSGYAPEKNIKKYFLKNIENSNGYKAINVIKTIARDSEINGNSSSSFKKGFDEMVNNYKEDEFETFIKTIK